MKPCTVSKTFRFRDKEVELKGINAFQCSICGARVYTEKEVKMIEQLMHALNERPNPVIDVLNLEETAEYLRVSNQTVYNMIKDGRIKAYKIGREWRFLRADILSYMNSSTNQDFIALAAKGGSADQQDIETILGELEKRSEEND